MKIAFQRWIFRQAPCHLMKNIQEDTNMAEYTSRSFDLLTLGQLLLRLSPPDNDRLSRGDTFVKQVGVRKTVVPPAAWTNQLSVHGEATNAPFM